MSGKCKQPIAVKCMLLFARNLCQNSFKKFHVFVKMLCWKKSFLCMCTRIYTRNDRCSLMLNLGPQLSILVPPVEKIVLQIHQTHVHWQWLLSFWVVNLRRAIKWGDCIARNLCPVLLFNQNKLWVKKRAHVQKMAISKKSTFFS